MTHIELYHGYSWLHFMPQITYFFMDSFFGISLGKNRLTARIHVGKYHRVFRHSSFKRGQFFSLKKDAPPFPIFRLKIKPYKHIYVEQLDM